MNTNDIEIIGKIPSDASFVLSDEAQEFLVMMQRFTADRRDELLLAREYRQEQFDSGDRPDFLKKTEDIRKGNWRVNNIPKDLEDRRVEMTGPVDRKMVINGLNSDAKVFIADFEDSHAPTWLNCLEGQVNLYDAVRKNITYTDPHSHKIYELKKKSAVLMVCPRGWHLDEGHVLIDSKPMSASIFDMMLYLFHNATFLISQGIPHRIPP